MNFPKNDWTRLTLKMARCTHKNQRIVYDGTENYRTAIRWCPDCGSIKHPVRNIRGELSKPCWQAPRSAKVP